MPQQEESALVSTQFFKDHPEEKSRAILESYRWPDRQVTCPLCGGWRLYREKRKGKAGYFRCRADHEADARRSGGQFVFSVRHGTILENSRLPLAKWLYCLVDLSRLTTGRATSVDRLSKDLGVTRKTAARQLDLILMLDDYFYRNKRCDGKLAVPQLVINRFYENPEKNRFLFQYRFDKKEELRLAHLAKEEAARTHNKPTSLSALHHLPPRSR